MPSRDAGEPRIARNRRCSLDELTDPSRLIIILHLEVLDWNGEKIGSPANLEQQLQAAPVVAPAAPAANGRGTVLPARGGAAKPGASRMGGKDMGPLYPIEGLSPYQNKWVAWGWEVGA